MEKALNVDFRRPEWRLKSGPDGEILVDLESGGRGKRLKGCQKLSSAGSLECVCLNLARSLSERVMVAAAMEPVGRDATGSTLEVRMTAVCLECRGRLILSRLSCSSLMQQLWQKSLESLAEGTSITWQMEARPRGRTSVFTIWRESFTPTFARMGGVESGSGTNTVDMLTGPHQGVL